MERCTAHATSVKRVCFWPCRGARGGSRREDEPDLRRVLSATLSCVETEDGEEEEAMIYKGASLLRAIGQLEGRIGKRGSSYKISQ